MPERELYIDDDSLLNDFLDELASVGTLALDTEFVRERTYFPQLCLIQIATGDSIACIDCLADIDLGGLLDVLLREDCAWIVHSSRQDLEVIYQHVERLPNQLIDTQIAAGLIGFAPQIGLQDIVADLLGVELDKTHTRTDWSRRPLPTEAVAYARDDVRSLHALWEELATKLDALGRREWLEQDCGLLLAQEPVTPVEQIFSRLKGLRSQDTDGQCAALTLVEWRERRARNKDRPRRWILSDEHLVGIARACPKSLDALGAIADLPKRLVEHAGREILTSLNAAVTPECRERVEHATTLEKPDKAKLRDLQNLAKAHAAQLAIYPEVLATKQDLVDLLLDHSTPRITETWRARELGELRQRLD